VEDKRTEKQKKIDELRKQLLAPREKGAKDKKQAMRAPGRDVDMDNKYKRVMDWGTPRLVTK